MDIKPITREEMYLAKAAGQDVSLPEPITRKEMFLAKIAGMEVETPDTITRLEMFANKAAVALNRSVIEPLEITENGTYTAPEGVDGYSPVVVNVATASTDVRYVTFMSYDGSEEYGKKAVAVGDDCADPIARGVFDTPTKESTAQYNYTFAGWATEENGGLNADALKAVTEDRTVYATFVSTVRYYTIRFFDGSTILKTENVAYGSTPVGLTPEKEGFGFEGWNPDLSVVTGDKDYTAVWSTIITFANASWSEIAAISESGQAREKFAIGDTKQFTVTYADGTTGIAKVIIAGFDHDDLTDGSGKAGMTIVFDNLLNIKSPWMSYPRKTYNGNIYTNSNLKTAVNGTMFNCLPAELQAVIKSVNKVVDTSALKETDYKNPVNIGTTAEKLWPLSSAELGYDFSTNLYEGPVPLGERYELFPSTNNYNNLPLGLNIGLSTNSNETKEAWLREVGRGHNSTSETRDCTVWYLTTVNSLNKPGLSNAIGNGLKTSKYVRLGFCI